MQSICPICGKSRKIVSCKEIRIRGGSYLIPQAIKEMSCRTCRVWSRAVAQLKTYGLLLLDQAVINWSDYLRQFRLGGRSGFMTPANRALVSIGILSPSPKGNWAVYNDSKRFVLPWDPEHRHLFFVNEQEVNFYAASLSLQAEKNLILRYRSFARDGEGDRFIGF
jgi:hypothetical protein